MRLHIHLVEHMNTMHEIIGFNAEQSMFTSLPGKSTTVYSCSGGYPPGYDSPSRAGTQMSDLEGQAGKVQLQQATQQGLPTYSRAALYWLSSEGQDY